MAGRQTPFEKTDRPEAEDRSDETDQSGDDSDSYSGDLETDSEAGSYEGHDRLIEEEYTDDDIRHKKKKKKRKKPSEEDLEAEKKKEEEEEEEMRAAERRKGFVRQLQPDEIKPAADKLLEAAKEYNMKNMRRLIHRYAKDLTKLCTMPGPEGYSVMTATADLGYVDIMKLLVNAGVPIHWADEHGWIALHSATRQGHDEFVRYLLR